MTPHGTRHSVKTLMEEQRIPEILSETHLRHDIPGVSAVYRHVTDAMRGELIEMMTREWEAALDARMEMSPGSSVAVVDALLRARAEARKLRIAVLDPREPPETSEAVLPFRGRTASDQRRGDRI
jgi:vacuolar-type H+-ATPase subunit C/Vma6